MNTKTPKPTATLIHRVDKLYHLASDMHVRARDRSGNGESAPALRALKAAARLEHEAFFLLLSLLPDKDAIHVCSLRVQCSKAAHERIVRRGEKHGFKALLTCAQ
jgi:hypothetical protein